MIEIDVSEVQITRAKNSLRIHRVLGERAIADFTIYDEDGTGSYVEGEPVRVIKNFFPPFLHMLFAGYISAIEHVRVPNTAIINHGVSCVGNAYLADKNLAAEAYEAKTAGFITDDLLTTYLVAEGVTERDIQAGVTIDKTIINYAKVTEALDSLAERSGYIWEIDMFKRLYFGLRYVEDAPFDVDSDIIKRGTLLVRDASPLYRNRQFIRAGKGETASQTETSDGDGDKTSFPMGYPLATAPTVTVNAVGQSVGIKGVSVGSDVYWSKGDEVLIFASAPGNGLQVVVTYIGLYDIIVMAEDAAAITARAAIEGGSGVVAVMDDEPITNTRDAALTVARSKLAKYVEQGRAVEWSLYDYGLEPGQLVVVDLPENNLNNAELLVETLDISEIAPDTPLYSIRALRGPEMKDWSRFFQRLSKQKADVLDQLAIGSESVLIVLQTMPEGITATVVPGAAVATGPEYYCSPAGVGKDPIICGFWKAS